MQRLIDYWFSWFPLWATPTWIAFVVTVVAAEISPELKWEILDNTGLFVLFAALIFVTNLMVLTAFWCCWRLDKTTRGWRKAGWYGAVLLLPPVGAPLCYFLKLRNEMSRKQAR
ncbi:MAG: hypothetical protein WD069_11980 [Planctomycetales bacterium]